MAPFKTRPKWPRVHCTEPPVGRGVHHGPYKSLWCATWAKTVETKWRVPSTRPSTDCGGHHDPWRLLSWNPSVGSFKAAKEQPLNGPRPPPRHPTRSVEGSLKGTLAKNSRKVIFQASLRSYEVRVLAALSFTACPWSREIFSLTYILFCMILELETQMFTKFNFRPLSSSWRKTFGS